MSIVTYMWPSSSKCEPKSIMQVFDVPETDVSCKYTGTCMVSTCCAFLGRNTDKVRQIYIYCILLLLCTGLMLN